MAEISLEGAFQSSPINQDYDRLGQIGPDGNKYYLVHQEGEGWSVAPYNAFWRMIRFIFSCFFKDTQLSHTVNKLQELIDLQELNEKDVPEALKARLTQLWQKTYPTEAAPAFLQARNDEDGLGFGGGNQVGDPLAPRQDELPTFADPLGVNQPNLLQLGNPVVPLDAGIKTDGLILNGKKFERGEVFKGKLKLKKAVTGYVGSDKLYNYRKNLLTYVGAFITPQNDFQGDIYVPIEMKDQQGNPVEVKLPNGQTLSHLPSSLTTKKSLLDDTLYFQWHGIKFELETPDELKLSLEDYVPNEQYMSVLDHDNLCFRGRRMFKSETESSVAIEQLWKEDAVKEHRLDLTHVDNGNPHDAYLKIDCNLGSFADGWQAFFLKDSNTLFVQSKNKEGQICRGQIQHDNLKGLAFNGNSYATYTQCSDGKLVITYYYNVGW